jgi:hypothetical protein
MHIGSVGDLHEPFTHPLYFDFCQDTFTLHGVDLAVFIGDVFDHHGISFHDHDPGGRSAGDELDQAIANVERWHTTYPDSPTCIGNHDERAFRVAKKAGLPARYLKDYNEVFRTPSWKWNFEHVIDGVLYIHGTGTSGKLAHINNAIQRRISVVQGHVHSWAGIGYHTNPTSRIFGMNTGCGIDNDAYAFDYGKAFVVRPVLGCGVIKDGEAFFFPMPIGRGEKYHKSRAGKKRRRRR